MIPFLFMVAITVAMGVLAVAVRRQSARLDDHDGRLEDQTVRVDAHADRLQRLERGESVEVGPVDAGSWAPVVPMDRRTS